MPEPQSPNTGIDLTSGGNDIPAGVEDNEIETLRSQLEDARQRALRAQADLDNYQKRVRKDMEEERRFAQLPLIRDLLPVMDNLNRAVQAAEANADAAGLLEGVRMVGKQLDSVLSKHHSTPVGALHEPFDPHRHQAVMQQPSADHPPHTVIQVLENGYQLHDRIIRPAQVVVSTSAGG